jgi:hypothetical protein
MKMTTNLPPLIVHPTLVQLSAVKSKMPSNTETIIYAFIEVIGRILP